ncbi:purine nucleosidase [Saccharopolyspora erythraea NRRL 2338]|uniref:Inosine-uridine preferring nucleoside hydrolase n=3 Tax=Saccharopolyspora erythraea TaxID=1836 RepID=A4FEN3_SACEN|nr:nucleoside hydrolase [Saccharopolyspora erythraea]PFG96233.1 purine nucleosidase [Saccharopolyspora erythraea NRRL 2338]QRK92760.1 nucleoside hydrolase [Saccharopolyspora erythraea]CAM02508.1 inosine-uridine preferring nucleoside hydrolase [Saccharopolyspora erythraea NRRL 2338]
MAPKETLIVDCDTGIDDALALLYLLRDPGVDIRAVTSVFGNTDVETAADNTLRVLELAGRTDIPVAIGARSNWRGSTHPAPHVHGGNGLGEVGLPAASAKPVREPAAELIVRLARENPGELHLLAVGPLTNLATALLLEPGLPGLVKHVTIMGGAVHHPGNVTPAAEANIHNDPEAARMVLAAGWDVTLVPLDVTMTEVITEELAGRLRAEGSSCAGFAAGILTHYLDFYEREVFGERGAACHDPLAAAIAVGDVDAELAPTVVVDVETGDGPGRGATIADTRGKYRGFPGVEGARVRVVLKTDGTFPQRLTERLCGPSGAGSRNVA